jgi:hypothetical protein
MTPPFAGQPGHGSRAFLRDQPARIVNGRIQGGCTGVYELICPSCGDDPYLEYSEVASRLQRLRGPRTLTAALAVYHQHLGIPWDENGSGSLGLGEAQASVLHKRTDTPGKRYGIRDSGPTATSRDAANE